MAPDSSLSLLAIKTPYILCLKGASSPDCSPDPRPNPFDIPDFLAAAKNILAAYGDCGYTWPIPPYYGSAFADRGYFSAVPSPKEGQGERMGKINIARVIVAGLVAGIVAGAAFYKE
jgi:hypothetical protein